jgi:hypothetical protein
MEEENRSLRLRVGDLMNQLDSQSQLHAEEEHGLKAETFKVRMGLEKTFRKELQGMDVK